jgi:prepilin-type N-terminal cleavage/methylation domain-containing protein
MVVMKNNNQENTKHGFTLIELLVVISIIGILMGIVGPKVFDLLGGSKGTKTQAMFRSWVTQIYQYKEHYKYFPPFLLEDTEGIPADLSDDEDHNAFIAALRGKSWNPDSFTWENLTGDLLAQNRKSKEFHSFSEDEFGNVDLTDESNNGRFLSDAWGGRKIYIVVDQDGDGLIKLDSSTVELIVKALQNDYDPSIVEQAKDKIGTIRDKVGVFALEDTSGETDTENVFSWNIQKYLGVD